MREDAKRTRHKLLQSASRVILSQGLPGLTLDAVAQQAEMSKGSLLYHFPSKDALIAGLLQQLVELMQSSMQAELAREAVGRPGRMLRAWIRSAFSDDLRQHDIVAALIVIVASAPDVLQNVRPLFEEAQREASGDGVEPSRAMYIWSSAFGHWLLRVFNLAPMTAQVETRMRAELLKLTE